MGKIIKLRKAKLVRFKKIFQVDIKLMRKIKKLRKAKLVQFFEILKKNFGKK